MTQTSERPVRTRPGRGRFLAVLLTALVLLFGVPWWGLVLDPGWPVWVFVPVTVVVGLGMLAFPWVMFLGHSRHALDLAARLGDTTLGAVWVLFAWTVLGAVPLALLGVEGSRIVALCVVGVSA